MTTKKGMPLIILCILLSAGLVLVPVHAAEKYLGEKPDLAVSIAGKNEYSPGEEATIVLLVENRATPATRIISPGQEQWADRPATAKLLRLEILPGDAPILVRTDPQMVGDLPLGEDRNVPFQIRVLENATGGIFTLPVAVSYSYLTFAEQVGSETQILHYKDINATLSVQLSVLPRITFEVSGMKGGEVCAGQEEEILVTVRNTGSLTGRDATVRIVRHADSPVIPVDGSAYIGEFAPQDEFSGKFRIRVSETAQNATYPLDVVIQYRDDEGEIVVSDPQTVGVPVLGKAGFSIEPAEVTIPQGLEREIALTFKNTGPVTLRSAQARIKVTEPFSSVKHTAALGDLSPGEEATVTFSLGVDKSATRKVYGLDAEVRYRDARDNQLVTSPVTLRVAVVERSISESITTNPVYMSIIIAAILGAGYVSYRWKNKRRK